MSVKESIIGTVAIVAVALIGIKLISTVEISPFVWTPLKMVSGFLLAVMALGLIAFAFMNAAQESGGEKRPAFLAAGATLIAMLAFLIQNAVEFQTASQAYRALGISAALLALAGVCLLQLQSSRPPRHAENSAQLSVGGVFAVNGGNRKHAGVSGDCVDAISGYGGCDPVVCADAHRVFLDRSTLGADWGGARSDVRTGACKMKQNEPRLS